MKKIYGLLGEQLSHSYSEKIHSFLIEKMDLPAAYFLFPLASNDLDKGISGLQVLGAGGVNVTVPYKEQVMPFLDELSPVAETCQAVNTLIFRDQKIIGDNTDYFGFDYLINQHQMKIKNQETVLLGSGGVAKTVYTYLKAQGAKSIKIYSIDQADKFFQDVEFNCYQPSSPPVALSGDLIINCTPVGMFPSVEKAPVSAKAMQDFSQVIDLIYNPLQTQFLKNAAPNALTATGLSMLVAQGIRSAELWHQIKIPSNIVVEIQNLLKKSF